MRIFSRLFKNYLLKFLRKRAKIKKQLPNQIVGISDWESASEYEFFFTKGSKEKMLLFCPDNSPFNFLIPGHIYMFKKALQRYPYQFWIEIVAYYIGTLMKVPVPPSFVAFSPEDNSYGVLTEWFYGFPNGPKQRFFEGGDYMKFLIEDYDSKRGRQHNFYHIEVLLRGLTKAKVLGDEWKAHWAKIFTFDAIIGNRDRHHENWGIIWSFQDKEDVRADLSPAYDNESSLGHEIPETDFSEFEREEKINGYINHPTKARHHMRWDINAPRSQFADMVVQYVNKFPDTKQVVMGCLDFNIRELEAMLMELTHFDIPVPLTKKRVNFMVRLVKRRQESLLSRVSK